MTTPVNKGEGGVKNTQNPVNVVYEQPPIVKWVNFFLGPWLLVCQSIEISNQMESNGKVSTFSFGRTLVSVSWKFNLIPGRFH